ncbi:MAG TPA: FG-GAP-like repeat-containing protein [Candidatus Sulfotelmatobacter sp.]|nr:FG-GAP-like repeat-containing protein [Candidatus Sulfotelmatobacter sp.]
MLRSTLSRIALYLLTAVGIAHAGQQFLEAPQYPAGKNPQAVAVGSFRVNGKFDIAVVNATSNTVSILLGNGDGTFPQTPSSTLTTGGVPQGIVVGDFNGDNIPDLAVTNSSSNTVSVFLGNGDGTFKPQVTYATGKQPQGIAAGDFNADGNLDLVVTNALDGTIGVFLGKGDGTFTLPAAAPRTGFNPFSVVVGDFNNDGKLDLAVACNNNNNIVSVFIGNGDGTFGGQNQIQGATGLNPVSIAAGDFNGDGYLDLAVAYQQGLVGVILNAKTAFGSFDAPVVYNTAAFPTSIVVGHFNGTANLDIAVAAGNGNTLSVLFGNGDGTFQPQVNYGTGDIPYAVATADFNGDGLPDLVVANSGGNNVSVLISNSNANANDAFQTRNDYPVGLYPNAVAVGDFNGDGILDLAAATSDCPIYPNCGAGTISVVLGNGDGTFGAPSHWTTGTNTDPYALAVADLRSNGTLDVAVANYATGTVSVMLGMGDGTFPSHADYPVGSEPSSVAIADVNGDKIPDLIVANFHSNTVSVLLGNGDGTFKPAVNYATGSAGAQVGPVSVAVGDVNGDGKPDLVIVNEYGGPTQSGSAAVLLGNGDGTFRPEVEYPTGAGGNPLSVALGDFNGDGNLDLAVADFRTQQVSILLGKGDGTFPTVTPYSTGANPSSVVVADFNGDGILDLALTSTPLGSAPGNLVSLLVGNGDGSFKAPALFGTGSQAYSAAAGDFNGSGALGLAVANGVSNTVSVLLNTQGSKMTLVSSGSPSVYGQAVTFTATVAASQLGSPTPTGTVTFKNGSTVLGSGTLSGGQVSASATALPAGTDTVSAIYSGDSFYLVHTVTVTQTVQQASTTAALVSSGNPSGVGQSVTFTATVSSATTGTPTGTVNFLDGATVIGSSALSGGVAAFSTSSLGLGTHSITAAYLGDSNFTGSTASVLSQVVQTPDFALSVAAMTPPSVSAGTSSSSTVTLTTSTGFDLSTVSLTCSVTPVVAHGPTCSLGAMTFGNTPGVGTSATATLTVPTTSNSARAANVASQRPGAMLAFGLLIPVMLLGTAGVAKHDRRKVLSFLFVFLVLSACMFQAACGGGGSSTTPPPSGGTPSGSYTITVTGSASGIQHTGTATLTVQ